MNNELIKDYLSTLKCSGLTKDSYRYDLKVFCDYLLSNAKEIKELEIIDVEKFLECCRKNGKSENTVLRYKVSLNRFFKYLVEKEYVKKNIIERVKIENCVKSKIFCKKNDCKTLYRYFKQSACLRDKIIFNLVYQYGVNPQEISNMKVSDFNVTCHTIKLQNRVLSLWNDVALDLIEYLSSRRVGFYVSPAYSLFVSKFGNTFSRVSIYKTINKKAKELNIKISPRDLRKRAILHMLKFISVEDVAEQLNISVERVLAYKEMI